MNTNFDWAEDIDAAVTVCDCEGTVLYMNQRVGQNLMPCHNDRSKAIIRDMIENNHPHCYTISKHGQRKFIYQTPWREDGEVRGLVEISIVLPDEMPHYDRG